MRILDNVTLFQLNCVDPEYGVNAMEYSSREIKFGERVMVVHEIPKNMPSDMTVFLIDKLTHIQTSLFTFTRLNECINTEFMLSIHPDGYVINPQNWSDEFFKYDYIGAPWPKFDWCKRNRVGNGGFVWKSKKFIELASKLEWNGQHDDVMVSNTYLDYFLSNGCIFAPITVASQFSLEMPIPEVPYDLSKCFGYHGKTTEISRYYTEFIKTYKHVNIN